MPDIVQRAFAVDAAAALQAAGLDPVLARVYAARGVSSHVELDVALVQLLAPESMRNLERVADILADAIAQSRQLLIVGDYDCDGSTASGLYKSRPFPA